MTEKQRSWCNVIEELRAILEGEDDETARMATICGHLKLRIPYASWVGFYRVVDTGILAVGPYQGPPGCLRIPFDRGVCGAAARSGVTQLVADVHAFPGHIACDTAARSEIVVPVHDSAGRVVAVLDLDSREPAAFDEIDRDHLESIARQLVQPRRN